MEKVSRAFRCTAASKVSLGRTQRAKRRGGPVLALLRLDAGVLDHFFPFVELDSDEVVQLFRRAGERLKARLGQDVVFDGRAVDDQAARSLLSFVHVSGGVWAGATMPAQEIHVEAPSTPCLVHGWAARGTVNYG